VFFACSWNANDAAFASCSLSAFWLAVWMPVEPDLQHLPSLPPSLDCSCSTDCSAEFSFDAFASLSTLFVCSTSPLSPSLWTRIG
jgi:hypothetical protein